MNIQLTIDTTAPLSDKDKELLLTIVGASFDQTTAEQAVTYVEGAIKENEEKKAEEPKAEEKPAPRRRAAAKKAPEPVAEEPVEEEVDETPAVLEEDTPDDQAIAESEVPSLEEVVKEASPLITAGRAPFVKKALKLAGVARVKELPEDQRVAFLANLKKTDDELDALLEG